VLTPWRWRTSFSPSTPPGRPGDSANRAGGGGRISDEGIPVDPGPAEQGTFPQLRRLPSLLSPPYVLTRRQKSKAHDGHDRILPVLRRASTPPPSPPPTEDLDVGNSQREIDGEMITDFLRGLPSP